MDTPSIAFVKHHKTGDVRQIGIRIPRIVFEKISADELKPLRDDPNRNSQIIRLFDQF